MDDLERVFHEGFDAVKAYVDRGFNNFDARLSTVELRELIPGPRGENGATGLPGKDGKDASECYAPDPVAYLIAKAVAALAESPEPNDASAVPLIAPRMRTVFERNDKNQIIGARQEPVED